MTTTPQAADIRPRRLALSADALEALVRRCPGGALPPGFGVLPASGERPATDPAAELRRAGALISSPGNVEIVHASLAADLAVLRAPEVLVLTRARWPGAQVTAAHAVRGEHGVGLIRADTTAVELSAWPGVQLGRELARLAGAQRGPRGSGLPSEGICVPCAALEVLPAALRRSPRDVAAVAAELGLPSSTVAILRDLVAPDSGALRAIVSGPGAARVGQVLWCAVAAGWLAVDPAAKAVRLRPVEPADLGACVAPLVAAGLSLRVAS